MMMPKNGIDIKAPGTHQTPIIMLRRAAMNGRVLGLSWAQVTISKPFNDRELVAYSRDLPFALGEQQNNDNGYRHRVGALSRNPGRREARFDRQTQINRYLGYLLYLLASVSGFREHLSPECWASAGAFRPRYRYAFQPASSPDRKDGHPWFKPAWSRLMFLLRGGSNPRISSSSG